MYVDYSTQAIADGYAEQMGDFAFEKLGELVPYEELTNLLIDGDGGCTILLTNGMEVHIWPDEDGFNISDPILPED